MKSISLIVAILVVRSAAQSKYTCRPAHLSVSEWTIFKKEIG